MFEAEDLNLFDKYEERRFLEDPLEELPSVSLQDCARKCLNREDGRCKSIVFFDDGSNRNCQLSDQHMENQWNRVQDQLKNFTIYSSEFVVLGVLRALSKRIFFHGSMGPPVVPFTLIEKIISLQISLIVLLPRPQLTT